jgi:hypothetical protein
MPFETKVNIRRELPHENNDGRELITKMIADIKLLHECISAEKSKWYYF